MLLTDPLCHSATLRVGVPAERAFDFLADGLALGRWSFGCWETQAVGPVFVGTSMMSGEATYVRIDADAGRLQVDYFVGSSAEALTPRIVARVVPAGQAECLVSLVAWRGQGASDERWRLTCAAHETEVFRIRYLIEKEV